MNTLRFKSKLHYNLFTTIFSWQNNNGTESEGTGHPPSEWKRESDWNTDTDTTARWPADQSTGKEGFLTLKLDSSLLKSFLGRSLLKSSGFYLVFMKIRSSMKTYY